MNRKWERFGNDATSRRTEQLCVAFPSADLQERSVAWPYSAWPPNVGAIFLPFLARLAHQTDLRPLHSANPTQPRPPPRSLPALLVSENQYNPNPALLGPPHPPKEGRKKGRGAGGAICSGCWLLAVAAFAFAIPQISVKSNQ